MPKAKLEHAFCLTAICEPGKKKTDYWDTVTTGFVIEVRSTGGRTYYLRYFDAAGRQRQHKIGAFGDITFDQARKAAKRLRSEVVLGGDPAGQKQVKKAIPTYASLAEQHLAHARTYQKRPDNTEAVLRRHILPRWSKLRLDEISPQAVAQWLAEKDAEGLKPATVEKIRATFGRSFSLGNRWNIPGAATNPVQGISRPRFNNARQRYLSAEEAEELRIAVEHSSNPQLKFIVGLLLLTGARVGELLRAEWKDVDLARRAWFIPDTKTGKPRHVPLSTNAMNLIQQLPRFQDCQFLVPNPETKRPFVSIKRAWQTARATAGLKDVTIHDLRHTSASLMVNSGVDIYTVGKILGHSDYKSTMRYSHISNDTLLAAVEAGAAKLTPGWTPSPKL
jgi:integrase